jgi:uncharacterized repeat protein (TIGR03803 family)
MKTLGWFRFSCIPAIFSVLAVMCASAQLTTLHNFAGPDGSAPSGPLLASDGNLYGTTTQGGAHLGGTVFKITPSGTLTTVYNFNGDDGFEPSSGLVRGSDGNFYGTTSNGGYHHIGEVFRVTPGGSLAVLHSFNYDYGDGGYPGAVAFGSDGNLYGTTTLGGGSNKGTFFVVSRDGNTFVTLYGFDSSIGANPSAALIQSSDGYFYGVAPAGGSSGVGTVFKISAIGSPTLLHNFCLQPNCTDGQNPSAALLRGNDGNFYGTAYSGGANGYGTIFKITSGGTLTTLHNFTRADGRNPLGALIQAYDGNFYGTTAAGGAHDVGTIFQMTPAGVLSSLHSFNTADGASPNSGVVQGSDGYFYGTTNSGGANNLGTVFKFQLTNYILTITPPQNGTVTSTDNFINCPGTCSHSYVENSQVNLTANPAQGYQFGSWGGACTGSEPTCIVTMTDNETVSASFVQSSYTLTVSISGQGSVTSTDGTINCPGTCTHTYPSFTQVILNAAAAHNWTFAGWSGACSGTGQCNLTMLGNYGVSAYFYQAGSGLQFSAVTPCRLVDTRQTGQPIQGGTSQNFNIPQLGGCNVPTSASAYSLNVTVIPRGTLGYITVWPAGLAQPLISTMNSRDGRNKAEAVIVQAGTNNAVSIYATNTTDVLLDVNGYFGAPGSQTYEFFPLTPCRVIDTRGATGELGGPPLVGTQARSFDVMTSSCMPSGPSIKAYSFNVTVVPYPGGQPLRYLTVWPEGVTQPTVSTLNNRTATSVANAAIVPAGTPSGGISVYASDSSQLIVDINGYFAASASGGLSLYPTAPCRVIDTRSGGGQPWQGEKTINVVGSPCAPPANAEAYVFNATVIPPGAMHYLTLWPDPQQKPNASTLNAIDGAVTSNMAIVPNTDGSTDAFASDATQLILDISSFFAP